MKDVFENAIHLKKQLDELLFNGYVVTDDGKYLITGYDFDSEIVHLEGDFTLYFKQMGKYKIEMK